MKKFCPLILAVVLIATLLAGCATPATPTQAPAAAATQAPVVAATQAPAATEASAPTAAPAAPAKDTLTVMATYKADTLDPAAGKMGDRAIWNAIFNTLLKYDDNGAVTAGLAEKWERSADGLTYTLSLRQDAKFHDGTPVMADDVIYTFDTIMKLPMYQQFLQTFAKWEKVDDHTVKITATTPSAMVPETLALMSFIVPKAAHSADPAAFEAKPIGSGPYKFVSRGADGTVTLEANADYFGGAPAFPKAVIKPPIEPSTAVVALENGEVDLVPNIPPAQLPIIEANDKLELVQVPGWGFYALAMMGPAMKDDLNLRKAIYHGIDRQKLVDVAMEGVGQAATDVFNAKVLSEAAGTVKNFKGYDEALAKEYLAKSNYKASTPLSLTIMANEAAMAQSIQDDLKKIGITVEIDQLDVNAWSDKILKGQAAMTLLQFGGVGSDMAALLPWFSNTFPYLGKDMYSTPEYEDLVVKIKAEPDPAKRVGMIKQAVQLQFDFANVVSLFDTVTNFAHRRTVTGIPAISAATGVFYVGDYKPAQ